VNNGNANLLIGDIKAAPESGDPGDDPHWHSRGYLPHFESPQVIQHVTFHLADSLPKEVLEQLEDELRTVPVEKQRIERRIRIEAWMDAGHGSCALREPAIAAMVQNSLLFFDAQRYRLLAWVVMPNHVHVLFQPINGFTVAKIVASWKKFTARKICDFRRATAGNANLRSANLPIGDINNPSNRVWHREYWDRFMRNEQHLQQAIEYIHQNPVKAGLATKAEDWPWSSVGYAGTPISGSPIS
jgi:putative transposase